MSLDNPALSDSDLVEGFANDVHADSHPDDRATDIASSWNTVFCLQEVERTEFASGLPQPERAQAIPNHGEPAGTF
jgi:hypothetical protein